MRKCTNSILYRSLSLILSLLAIGFLAFVSTPSQDGRQFRLDDKFNLEDVGQLSFAPDGQALAYIRLRSMNSLPKEAQSPLGLLPREDIWIQEAPGKQPYRITDGEKDASKWWKMSWSPDGKLLAFLSTRGGNVTIWIWDRGSRLMRQASTQGVIAGNQNIGSYNQTFASYKWIGNGRILFVGLANGEHSLPVDPSKQDYIKLPQEAWEKARRGDLTASPVSSRQFYYPKANLNVLDVKSREVRRIATFSLRPRNNYPDYWPSPDGRFVVFASTRPSAYNFQSSMRMGLPHDVELSTIEGIPVQLNKQLPENIHTQTIKWSPDGKELAFFANGSEPVHPALLYGVAAADVMPKEEWNAEIRNPAKLYRVNVEKKTVEEISTSDIDLGYLGTPDFLWNAAGELLFHVSKKQLGQTAGPEPSRGAPWGWGTQNAPALGPQPRKEWVVLSRSGNTRSLSKGFEPQGKVWSINDAKELLAISGGEVEVINSQSGERKNLTERFRPRVTSIFRTDETPGDGALIKANEFPPSVSKIVISADGAYNVLDVAHGAIEPISRPSSGALSAFNQSSGSSAFVANGVGGTFLRRVNGEGAVDSLLETNTYLTQLSLLKRFRIEYRSMDGMRRNATVVYPTGYNQNRRYPVFVSFYPTPSSNEGKTEASGPVQSSAPPTSYVTSVAVASGYVALEAIVPRNVPGIASAQRFGEEGSSCPYQTNSIVPAVEKLVEMGIADPDRLFISGSSFGGWSTLCVLGQTRLFTAAMAASTGGYGDYELTALFRHGILRYSDNPASSAGQTQVLSTLTNVPWWRDSQISRNNPITYADRIQTPVMLIHGDLDPVPIEFSETFFNALVSMRKPAEFIRYWGEGHVFENPANIRDSHMRTLAWFDRWGDIARDEAGNMIWDSDRVKGRKGTSPLKPEDYAKFDLFQPSPARREPAVSSKQ